ncbi:MAG: hypothetical protein DRP66_00715 [Planctomycetota bacterium]|nr:MAG: hypothetical protein DRP66_00715 [Planctomycetota bacterium]
MSNSVKKKPSRQKIQQLLDAAGVESAEDTKSNIDAYDYNWTQPHCFSSCELKKLESFTEKVAKSCARKFTELCHSDFGVTIGTTTQYFADKFTASVNAQSDHYLSFGTGRGEPSGFLGIPGQTAIVWATQLLGDSKSPEDADRELSQLEKSLLYDTASGIVEALSGSSDSCDFQPAAEIVSGRLPIEFQGAEEVCKITLKVKKADSDNASEAYFLMLCDELRPIVAGGIQAHVLSAEEVSDTMLKHVHEMPITVKAQLDSTVLTIEEAMSLGVDDILLLDKKVDEPIELIVEGRILFRGRPAKCDGKYAVVISETAYDTN